MKAATTAKVTVTANKLVEKHNPQAQQEKETKYCKILKSIHTKDKEGMGYTYAFEKLFIKELEREEIRICLYKDMRDRSGQISNRMLVRPVDLTEMEFVELFQKAFNENLFTDECKTYLRNIVNQK